MELNKIKKQFENKSLENRIDFIASYDFQNDIINQSYFIEVISQLDFTSNYWYNTIMVDLAGTLKIKTASLLKKYLDTLVKPNHNLLKLAIFDYITETYHLYKKNELQLLEVVLNTISLNKYYRLIVRNQALLLLILIFTHDREKNIAILKKNHIKATDYRCHIRTLNFIYNFLLKTISKQDILDMIQITRNKNLGLAVEEALEDLDNELN